MGLDTITKVASYSEANNMIEAGDVIVAGISGGADSVCLLFLLCVFREEMDLDLHVIHVNHGIREEAGEDEQFVRNLCDKLGVDFDAVHSDIPALSKKWSCSEEEAGRRVRYTAFEDMADKLSSKNGKKVKIAVAHNKDDDAETVLFHLFRGSGLHGLTGIPPVRTLNNANIVRPLLCLSRAEIEEFLSSNGITWVTDKTNNEDIYARNRIRHNVIPVAESICEGAMEHITATANQLREVDDLVEELAQDCLKDAIFEYITDKKIVLSIPKILSYHAAVKKRALHTALKLITGGGRDIGSLQIEQICELMQKEGNATVDLARGVAAQKEYEKLILFKKQINAAMDDLCENKAETIGLEQINMEVIDSKDLSNGIDGLIDFVSSQEESNKYTKWLDYDKIDGQIEIRNRRPGDFFLIALGDGNFGKKDIKKYMIDQKIPAKRRDEIAVVATGNKVLWLVGYRISDDCRISKNTNRILKLSLQKEEC